MAVALDPALTRGVPMKFAAMWPLVKETGKQFWADKGPRLGAALAFYTALSISPLLLVIIAIAGAAFGEQAARGEVANQIRDMVGDDGAAAIQSMLASQQSHSTSVLMTVVGVVTLVVGASGVFAQLQDALDTIWNVPPDQVEGRHPVHAQGPAGLVLGGLRAGVPAARVAGVRGDRVGPERLAGQPPIDRRVGRPGGQPGAFVRADDRPVRLRL